MLTFCPVVRRWKSGVSATTGTAVVHAVVVNPRFLPTMRSPSSFSIKYFLLHQQCG